MAFLTRVISFLGRYLLKHPLYTIVYMWAYFLDNFSFRIVFYKPEEIVEQLKRGASILRLGDGDIVSVPLDIKHTAGRPDPIIKKWYKDIVSNYTNDSPYILSVPRFLSMTNVDIKKIGPGKFTLWLPVKVMFLLNFNKKVKYMDAHNFYYDNYFEGVVAPILKDKKIVFVGNANMVEKQKNNLNLPWKDMAFITAPSHNAIDAYDEIVSGINDEIKKHDKKDVVLFIAIGPVAKHLVYEYSHKGYQSIDIGRVADVMFTGESIQQFSI